MGRVNTQHKGKVRKQPTPPEGSLLSTACDPVHLVLSLALWSPPFHFTHVETEVEKGWDLPKATHLVTGEEGLGGPGQ